MELSFVFVHYRTPMLLRRSLDSVQAELEEIRAKAEVVIVENGGGIDRELFPEKDLKWVIPEQNLGFAGGVNRGVEASLGDSIVVLNPDVELRSGCLGRMRQTAAQGAEVVGPRLEWEEGWWHPPTEKRTLVHEFFRALGTRSQPTAQIARRSWRRHVRRLWASSVAVQSPWLSGAFLLIRRDAFDRVGPFDEAFFLYFEETDWLMKAHRLGLKIVYEPRARALHHWSASAGQESESSRWFEESRQLFFRRWYGPAMARCFESLARPPSPADQPREFGIGHRWEEHYWAELSPVPWGFPAAGRRMGPEEKFTQSERIRKRTEKGQWWIRTVDDRGRERSLTRWPDDDA